MLRAVLAGVEEDRVNLPEDPGSAVVWVVMLGAIIALYVIIRRTRDRAERDFEERRRKREEGGS